jgi:hypothetical protein
VFKFVGYGCCDVGFVMRDFPFGCQQSECSYFFLAKIAATDSGTW